MDQISVFVLVALNWKIKKKTLIMTEFMPKQFLNQIYFNLNLPRISRKSGLYVWLLNLKTTNSFLLYLSNYW